MLLERIGASIRSPNDGFRSLPSTWGGKAYADLPKPPVHYVVPVRRAIHPRIEGRAGRGRTGIRSDALAVPAPVVAVALQAFADVAVREVVFLSGSCSASGRGHPSEARGARTVAQVPDSCACGYEVRACASRPPSALSSLRCTSSRSPYRRPEPRQDGSSADAPNAAVSNRQQSRGEQHGRVSPGCSTPSRYRIELF